jgi:hypothetical protein
VTLIDAPAEIPAHFAITCRANWNAETRQTRLWIPRNVENRREKLAAGLVPF